jgi:hypothetical protein
MGSWVAGEGEADCLGAGDVSEVSWGALVEEPDPAEG